MSQVDKKELRQAMLDKRLSMGADEVRGFSEIVQQRLLESEIWPATGRVGLYSPVKNEVETMTLFQVAAEQGLHVFFPRVAQGIWYYEVDGPEHLQRGAWGVMEPLVDCEPLPEGENLDLLIVPGIVFSRDCYRIGYGRGLYDRFLESAPMKRAVGLAYEMQIVNSFVTDAWDIRLDTVITEQKTYLPDCPSDS